MKLDRTSNLNLIRAIATDPDVWVTIGDDFTPSPDEWEPPMGPAITWLVVTEEKEVLGLFCLVAENSVCYQAHILMLQRAWGKQTLEACHEMYRWVWEHTPCMRITGSIPILNRPALAVAGLTGMTRYGLNPKSFLKAGSLYDQVLVGLSRPEVTATGVA